MESSLAMNIVCFWGKRKKRTRRKGRKGRIEGRSPELGN
jgi:hypothetical protein